jgi:hypothetical protein
MQMISSGALDKRSYSRDAARNGQYGWAGEYARFFFGQDNHELMLGLRYLAGNARETRYDHRGWEGSFRLLFKLPYGFELGPNFSFTRESYRGPATSLETDNRLDRLLRAGASLTWRITEDLSWEAGWQYSDNDSNSALYDYDQRLLTTGVAWNF